jgi:NAD+-dependent farnesol dehydrogenase
MPKAECRRPNAERQKAECGPVSSFGIRHSAFDMKILVTGGTGYLGAAIVRALASRGYDVTVFARHASSAARQPRVEPFDGDIRDRPALERAARGAGAICHAAALVSIWRRRRQDFDDVNVGGLEHVLAVARALGVSRVVYTSSFLARPPAGSSGPIAANDYQRTKVLADRVAARAIAGGEPVICLYPGVVYGPGVMTEGNLVGRLLDDHRRGRLPGLIGPERIWSFAYVEDVAAAHAEAIARGTIGARYEIGGENAPQIRPFEIARARIGLSLPRRIPPAVARGVGFLELARARMTGRLPLLTPGTVEILTRDWPLDRARAAAELGYRVTPLETGMARLLEDWQPGGTTL